MHVHAFVLVEAAVLRCHQGVFDVLGDPVAGYLVAALFENPGHGGTGGVVNCGDAGDFAVREVGEVGLHRLVGAGDGGAAQACDGSEA